MYNLKLFLWYCVQYSWNAMCWETQIVIFNCMHGYYCHVQSRQTPLHFATQNGHAKVVKILIRSGADINAATKVQVK